MGTSRERLPPRHDIHLVFALCVFFVHAWAIIGFLWEVPSLVLRMTYWEILAAGAYTLSFALFESLVLLGVLLLVAVLLPGRLFRDQFAIKGSVVLYALMLWSMVLFLMLDVRPWIFCLPLAVGFFITLGLLYLVTRRPHRAAARIALLERLSVLSYLYVVMDVLGVLAVIARNI